MCAATNTSTDQNGLARRFKSFRRRHVKRLGKRFVRGASDFLGRQSKLEDVPVFDKALFPFVKQFEANWRAINDELNTILQAREHIPPFQAISPDQSRITNTDEWRTFILYGFGFKSERNCAQCPETTKLLESVPTLKTAWFSILDPGYQIPAHRGVTKGILRVHLGLKVPKHRENCFMRVETEKCVWEEGKCIVFDDTYDHEVQNNTDDERVVLLFDFERPLKWRGWLLSKFILWGIRFTAYVQDGKRNMTEWEDRFEAAIMRADALTEPTDEKK
jgi:beta-hydroxylase